MRFLDELKRRNIVLYWFGILNFLAAIVCIILIASTSINVNGINAFIKPLKFYLSIGIFVWTMGWLMYYLNKPKQAMTYNIMVVIVMVYETFVITWQAANGRLSHFNISSSLYASLFTAMGIAITVLTIWTGVVGFQFFRVKDWHLPRPYLWGIRLGILSFVIFAFEGGLMAAALRHSVGGLDSDPGLPMMNWNRVHGDLRVAHFLGLHSLQLFPLFGYYLAKTPKTMFVFATVYLLAIFATFLEALAGKPFF